MSFDTDDSSYLWGDGLFETMQVLEGRVVAFNRHMRRLERSLNAFDYPIRAIHVEGSLEPESRDDGLLRVTVSRSGRISTTWRERKGPQTVHLTAMPGWYDPHDVLAEHKTTSYLKNLEIRRRAQKEGFDDGLAVTPEGRVGEASMANILARFDETIVTPGIEGILPGVTRERVLEIAASRDLPVEERAVSLDELEEADAVVLTSSGVGAAPVSALDDIIFAGSESWATELNSWLEDFE